MISSVHKRVVRRQGIAVAGDLLFVVPGANCSHAVEVFSLDRGQQVSYFLANVAPGRLQIATRLHVSGDGLLYVLTPPDVTVCDVRHIVRPRADENWALPWHTPPDEKKAPAMTAADAVVARDNS